MARRVILTFHENNMMELDAGGQTMDDVEGQLLRALAFCQRTLTVAAVKASLTSGVVLGGRFPKGPPA